jgi:methylmalonyl-CoA carboxyltransferase large subunit
MALIVLTFLFVVALGLLATGLFLVWLKADRAADQQQKAAQQVQQLTSTVRVLEAQIAQLVKATSPTVVPASTVAVRPPPAAVESVAAAPEEEITPELLVVMAAAVTVFLGKTVRIRSAKRLQSPYEIVNPWAQQGRVFVQASHNLR